MAQKSPFGSCLCGCGKATRRSFAAGHDRWAESALTKMKHGDIRGLLSHYGYSRSGKNLRRDFEQWQKAHP